MNTFIPFQIQCKEDCDKYRLFADAKIDDELVKREEADIVAASRSTQDKVSKVRF